MTRKKGFNNASNIAYIHKGCVSTAEGTMCFCSSVQMHVLCGLGKDTI